jgi:hypothetical protein
MEGFMRLAKTIATLAAISIPLNAAAQTDAPVKDFPTLIVTDASGRETQGRLVNWADGTLVMKAGGQEKTFAPGDFLRVDIKGDSLKNGALIGAGVGALLGGLMVGACGGDCGGAAAVFFLTNVAMYSAIGTAFDAMNSGRTPLWQSGGPTYLGNPGSAKSMRFKITPQRTPVLQSKSGVIKGAIIGGGIGAVLGPTIGAESCPENKKYQCVLKGGITLGAVGALIGWLK